MIMLDFRSRTGLLSGSLLFLTSLSFYEIYVTYQLHEALQKKRSLFFEFFVCSLTVWVQDQGEEFIEFRFALSFKNAFSDLPILSKGCRVHTKRNFSISVSHR